MAIPDIELFAAAAEASVQDEAQVKKTIKDIILDAFANEMNGVSSGNVEWIGVENNLNDLGDTVLKEFKSGMKDNADLIKIKVNIDVEIVRR